MPTIRSAESSRRGSRAGLVEAVSAAPGGGGGGGGAVAAAGQHVGGAPAGAAGIAVGSRRREKAKTSLYAGHYETADQLQYSQQQRHRHREATVTPGARSNSRPRLATRTNSAPLVHTIAPPGTAISPDEPEPRSYYATALQPPPIPRALPGQTTNTTTDGQDEDEVAGVVGTARTFQPFQNVEHSDALPEINIAVIGAEGVGKSTFVQKAFDLPDLPRSQAAECRIPINGNTFIVRLLEVPFEDLDIDDDEAIGWPDTIEDKVMPKVDGALALYDVQDKESVEDLPDMLNAISKAALPTVLVSCKCDTPPAERQVDPAVIEYNAKRVMASITTLQTSQLNPDSHKRGVFSLLKAIVHSSISDPERQTANALAMAHRRRTQSNAVRPVSPRPPNLVGHSRASSEYTGGLTKGQRHVRHDSAEFPPSAHLRPPRNPSAQPPPLPTLPPNSQDSFFLEESPSEASQDSARSSLEDDRDTKVLARSVSMSSLSGLANGVSFDELVDRLLAQPTTKADAKFAAIFLALYRLFAAPARLLDAFIDRFDTMDRAPTPQMTKTVSQLRYLAILEQWVGGYPGDFAHPRTKRRIRAFASKLAENRIFAMAARIIDSDLDMVKEDDDTNWAFCDRDWLDQSEDSRSSRASNASTLVDDPLMMFKQDLSGSTLNDDVANMTALASNLKLGGTQLHESVESAQHQASLLQPIPTITVTKIQWRALMDFPDDMIARELTRIDWTMFLSIRPRDLVRHVNQTRESSSTTSPPYHNLAHVNRMIDHFNRLAAWVANYVLLRDKPKHRAQMLEKFMRIARRLRELNNYNALGALIAGLKSSAVYRLAATRDLLPPAVGRDWLKLEILMAPSKSHFAYRLAWENSPADRIPYLPLHRRDLATAEEGNKTFIGDESDGRINWKKFEIMGDVIVGMQRAQAAPTRNLTPSKGSEQVRELILDVKLMKDEEDLYERSLQCEAAAGSANTATAKFKEFFKR